MHAQVLPEKTPKPSTPCISTSSCTLCSRHSLTSFQKIYDAIASNSKLLIFEGKLVCFLFCLGLAILDRRWVMSAVYIAGLPLARTEVTWGWGLTWIQLGTPSSTQCRTYNTGVHRKHCEGANKWMSECILQLMHCLQARQCGIEYKVQALESDLPSTVSARDCWMYLRMPYLLLPVTTWMNSTDIMITLRERNQKQKCAFHRIALIHSAKTGNTRLCC